MKAKIKGILVPDDSLPIPFLYNPVEFGDDKDTDYAEIKPIGYGDPNYHFVSGGTRIVEFSLHFNDRILQHGTLELLVKAIRKLQYPSREIGMIKKSPPTITFIFGPFIMRGKIRSTKILRQQFGEYLSLREVTIGVTLNQVPNPIGVLGFVLT